MRIAFGRMIHMGLLLRLGLWSMAIAHDPGSTEEKPLFLAASFGERGSHSGSLSCEGCFTRDILRCHYRHFPCWAIRSHSARFVRPRTAARYTDCGFTPRAFARPLPLRPHIAHQM